MTQKHSTPRLKNIAAHPDVFGSSQRADGLGATPIKTTKEQNINMESKSCF